MLKQKVYDVIASKLKTKDFVLLTPKNEGFGDYALHKSQLKDISSGTHIFEDELFEKVQEQGPFINFYIHKHVLLQEMALILSQKTKYGKQITEHIKIMFEYGQPNTHKVPHIGHLFSYCYGESSVRLLEFVGNTLFRANYQGDIGLHVAKCLWAFQKPIANSGLQITNKPLKERVEYLQSCYQNGSKAYEEDENARHEIDELNTKIYKKDSSIEDIWSTTRQWCLDYYKEFENRLGIHYDKSYFESQVFQKGIDIVKKNIGTVFVESQGAVIFKGEDYGLHTRVFLNKYGNPTYEAKDLGLVTTKYEDWPFDKAVVTTATEQSEYWRVVKQVIELVRPDLKGKIEHTAFGMIGLASGKMSSRTGEILTAFQLVEEVKTKVKALTVKNEGYSPEQIEDISEKMTMGAIKYAFLKSEAKKNMTFDIEESISIHGNSGPYLQYTFARCMSLLGKSITPMDVSEYPLDLEPEEEVLLKMLVKFPEVVTEAAHTYSPHIVCTYLFKCAQTFNTFYEKLPVLKAESKQQMFRLQLTQSTAYILESGLHLLGIEAIEKI